MTKPPKIRFRPGMKFRYDGSIWTLIYMYRLEREQGVWYHVLEEEREETIQGRMIKALIVMENRGYKGEYIIYNPFRSEMEAHHHFRDRYMNGSQMTKTTQQLLALEQVKND